MPRRSKLSNNVVLAETLAENKQIQEDQKYTLLEVEALLRVPKITIMKWIYKGYVDAEKESYTDYSNIPKKGGFIKIRKKRLVISGTVLDNLATALTNELGLRVASKLIVDRVFGSSLRNSMKQVIAYSCMRILERRNYFRKGMLRKNVIPRTEIDTLSMKLEPELRKLAQSQGIIKSADILESTTLEQYTLPIDFSNIENIKTALLWLLKQTTKKLEELERRDFASRGLEPLLTFGHRNLNDRNASTAECVELLANYCSLEFDSSRARITKTNQTVQPCRYKREYAHIKQNKPLILEAFLEGLDQKSKAKAERFDRITLERFRRAYSVLNIYNPEIAEAFKKNILNKNKRVAERIICETVKSLDAGIEIEHVLANAEKIMMPDMIEIGNRLNSIFGSNNKEHDFVFTLLREFDRVSCSALEACVKKLYETDEFEDFLRVFAIIVKKELKRETNNTLLIAGAFAFCMHMGTEEQRNQLLEELHKAEKLPCSEISSRVCSCIADIVSARMGETIRPLFQEFAQDNKHRMEKLASACIMTGEKDFQRLCTCISELLESGNLARPYERMTDNGESAFTPERFGHLQAMLFLFSASHIAICSDVVFTIKASIDTLNKIFIAKETLVEEWKYNMKPNGNGVLVFERTLSKGKTNHISAIEINPSHILACVESLINKDQQATINSRRTDSQCGVLMNKLGQNMVNASRKINSYDYLANKRFFNALEFQNHEDFKKNR